MNFPRKIKDLADVAGRRRESLTGGTTARPGSKIGENVRFGRLGPFPGPSATYASSPARPPGPCRPGSRAPTGALATYRANLLDQTVLYLRGIQRVKAQSLATQEQEKLAQQLKTAARQAEQMHAKALLDLDLREVEESKAKQLLQARLLQRNSLLGPRVWILELVFGNVFGARLGLFWLIPEPLDLKT